jgi:multicomponent Na+:H+ antiporter subunit G
MDMLATLFLALGALMLVAAAIGVVKLPDALSRQHAATKAGTLALALLCIGALLAASMVGAWWRLAAIMLLLLVTMPIASHLLARAAARELYRAGEMEAAAHVQGRRRGRNP